LSSIKQLLRIKSKNVLTLVHNDLLSCERGPTIDGYPTWQFSIADLQGLFSSIERHIPSFSGIDDKAQLMTFYDTRQLLSANHFSTLEFYRLVVSGKLRPCQRMDMFHIDSFLFDKLEVKRFVKKRLKELYKEGYTMKEFKDLIGVGLDVAYDLEKNGKIKAQYSGMPKVGKIISQEAAEQFHSTYVTSSAIAKACKVSANTVIKCLSRAGKHPVSDPSVDGGACYLYLRKVFGRFRFRVDPTFPSCEETGSRTRSNAPF
jgi:hypothetical protein